MIPATLMYTITVYIRCIVTYALIVVNSNWGPYLDDGPVFSSLGYQAFGRRERGSSRAYLSTYLDSRFHVYRFEMNIKSCLQMGYVRGWDHHAKKGENPCTPGYDREL